MIFRRIVISRHTGARHRPLPDAARISLDGVVKTISVALVEMSGGRLRHRPCRPRARANRPDEAERTLALLAEAGALGAAVAAAEARP
jgi:hydrogenase expression/formation protein HypC